MKTQNVTMKPPPTARVLRIQARKDEIDALGCCVVIHKLSGEMWVNHLGTLARAYTRFNPYSGESIEKAWEICLNIAQGMDSDLNTRKLSRAERLKNKIRELGCTVKMSSYDGEITVRHKELKETAFVDYTPRDRQSIEEGLEEALKIAENFAIYHRMASESSEQARQVAFELGGEE